MTNRTVQVASVIAVLVVGLGSLLGSQVLAVESSATPSVTPSAGTPSVISTLALPPLQESATVGASSFAMTDAERQAGAQRIGLVGVGVVPCLPTVGTDVLLKAGDSVLSALKQGGLPSRVYGGEGSDPVASFNSAVAGGAKGIIVCAPVLGKLGSSVDQAVGYGIAIVAYGSADKVPAGVMDVKTMDSVIGFTVGQWIGGVRAQLFQDQGDVIVFSGAGTEWEGVRVDEVKQGMSFGDPGSEPTQFYSVKDDTDSYTAAFAQALKDHPTMRAIGCLDWTCTSAVFEALKKSSLPAGSMYLVGVDGNAEIRNSIRGKGWVAAYVDEGESDTGQAALTALLRRAAGVKDLPKYVLFSAGKVVDLGRLNQEGEATMEPTGIVPVPVGTPTPSATPAG